MRINWETKNRKKKKKEGSLSIFRKIQIIEMAKTSSNKNHRLKNLLFALYGKIKLIFISSTSLISSENFV